MTSSFYMHPKYQEFLGSIKNLESEARINPNALNLAFDVWLLSEGNMSESKAEWLQDENDRLSKQVEQLIRDMHRIDTARQAAVIQCAALAEQVELLTTAINEVRA